MSEELDKDATSTPTEPKKVEIDTAPKPKPKRHVLAWFIVFFVVSLAANAYFIKDKMAGGGAEDEATGPVGRMFSRKPAGPAPGVVEASKDLLAGAGAELEAALGLCREGDYRNARLAVERAEKLTAIASKLNVPPAEGKAAPDAKGILEKMNARTIEGYASAESELAALFPETAPAPEEKKAEPEGATPAEPAQGEAGAAQSETEKPAAPEATAKETEPAPHKEAAGGKA